MKDIPEKFTLQDIWVDNKLPQYFSDLKIKAFKFVKLPDGKTKWLTYYETYLDKRNALETGIPLGGKIVRFEHHSTSALGFKSTRRSSKKEAMTSPTNSTSARGGKKSATQKPG